MTAFATAMLDSVQLKDGHIITAKLLRMNGQRNETFFDLDNCLGNIDGKFGWGARGFSWTSVNIGLDMSNAPSLVRHCARLKKINGSYIGDAINLNEHIANIDGVFGYSPSSEKRPPDYQVPTPIDAHKGPSPEQNATPQVPPEQAKGAIMTLPPSSDLCTAFAAILTEPGDRQLRFTACPVIAIPSFSAVVTLHYTSISEASGIRSFGGSVSKTKISLYLDNGVQIMGEVTQGGPDMEVTIAGSGHWGISR